MGNHNQGSMVPRIPNSNKQPRVLTARDNEPRVCPLFVNMAMSTTSLGLAILPTDIHISVLGSVDVLDVIAYRQVRIQP